MLDVSSIQGEVDWKKVRAAGYRGAYLRLTRGIEEVDTHSAKNLAGCLENGILPGFYHRAFKSFEQPDVQALHFASHLQRVAPLTRMLAPCLDYEDQIEGKAFCQEFIRAFREYSGHSKVMVYTSGSYVDAFLGGESWMDTDTSLWIADSGKWTGATPGKPKYLTPRVVLHQHSGPVFDVPGIPAGVLCDVNVTTGDISRAVTGPDFR